MDTVHSPSDSSPDDVRALGWKVAAHYDGTLSGHTFWLFVRDGEAVRGVGTTDAEALADVRRQVGLRGGRASPVVTLEQRVAELKEEHRGLRAASRATGVDFGYLSRLNAGRRVHPSDEILASLGLRRVTTYVRI